MNGWQIFKFYNVYVFFFYVSDYRSGELGKRCCCINLQALLIIMFAENVIFNTILKNS